MQTANWIKFETFYYMAPILHERTRQNHDNIVGCPCGWRAKQCRSIGRKGASYVTLLIRVTSLEMILGREED